MLTSIVIPAYNAQSYIAETINSVLRQTVSDWELVIIDDGSQDDTYAIAVAVAGGDARIRVLRQDNGGVADARNGGFRHCNERAAYVLFLDNDDVLAPDALQTLQTTLEANPECPGAHGRLALIDGQGNPLYTSNWLDAPYRCCIERGRGRKRPPGDCTTFAQLVVRNIIQTPGTVLLRRQPLVEAGGFDPEMGVCDDWDLWLRLTRVSALCFCDGVVLKYRMHASNASHNRKGMRDAEGRCLHKTLIAPDNTPEQRQMVLAGYRYGQRLMFQEKLTYAAAELRKGRFRTTFLQSAYGLRHLMRSFETVS